MKNIEEMQAVILHELKQAGIKAKKISNDWINFEGGRITFASASRDSYHRRHDGTARLIGVKPDYTCRYTGEPTRTFKLRKDDTFNIEGIITAAQRCKDAGAAHEKLRKLDEEREATRKAHKMETCTELGKALGVDPNRFSWGSHEVQEGVSVEVDKYGKVQINMEGLTVEQAMETLKTLGVQK